MITLWYAARGTGLAALVLLTLTTALGAVVTHRREPGRRYVLQYLHRVTAGLGLAALAVHIVTIIADSYSKVGVLGAIIPFSAGYRPTWTGFGTIATYLFVLAAVLGLARGRMAASPLGARMWRGLHALAYAGWLAAVLHGFNSGTDSSVGWVRLLYLGCVAAVAGSVAGRLVRNPIRTPARRFADDATPPVEDTVLDPYDHARGDADHARGAVR